MRETGIYQKLGSLNYFIPHNLPPASPPLELTSEIMNLYGEASFALGQLNEMGTKLPDPKRFIRAYVIKEALLSSAIEGIHTTLIDVFTNQLENSKPNKDTQLVLNYTYALNAALSMLRDEGMPIVTRVILRTHKVLMSAGEGDKATPGSFRKQSVRVGELIPPPAPEVPRLIGELEKYMNEPSEIPPIIRAGLAHIQFETIHPFLDGNGRIGRLLIVLMLINDGLISAPILYPSYYFKKHHLEYYQRLDRVRTHGDFEGWIVYYLTAIRNSAMDAYKRAKDIEALGNELQYMIQNDHGFAKTKETALLALDFLFTQPITGIAEMSKKLGKAYNTVQSIFQEFIKHDLIAESTASKRNKLYRFGAYIKLLEKEYE